MERARLLGRQTTTARAPGEGREKSARLRRGQGALGACAPQDGKTLRIAAHKCSDKRESTPVYHSRVTRRDDIFHPCPATPESPPFPFTPAKRRRGCSRA